MQIFKLIVTFFMISFLFFSLNGCMVNPVTLEQEFNVISEEREINIGRNSHPAIVQQFGYYQNPRLQKYVNEVGQKLVKVCLRRDIDYHFTVLDSPVENAFAVPGGYIYITRGLLARLNSEAELAGVLGHEIGHVVGRDSAGLMSQTLLAQIAALAGAGAAASGSAQDVAMASNMLLNSIMLGYGREKEFLADAQGLDYMYKVGYDPMQMVAFQQNLSRTSQSPVGLQAYNITHPNIFDRIERCKAQAKGLVVMQNVMAQLGNTSSDGDESASSRKLVLANKYKSYIEGLSYGPRERLRHIKIYTAKQGDTLPQIAKRTLGSSQKAKKLAELNGLQIESQLLPGSKIKIIY